MTKRNLQEMTLKQLFEYRKQLSDIYKRLEIECENWIKTNRSVESELKQRAEDLEFLMLEAELDRKNSDYSDYGINNHIH